MNDDSKDGDLRDEEAVVVGWAVPCEAPRPGLTRTTRVRGMEAVAVGPLHHTDLEDHQRRSFEGRTWRILRGGLLILIFESGSGERLSFQGYEAYGSLTLSSRLHQKGGEMR